MMDVLTQFVKSEDNPSFILGWGSMGHIGEAKLRDLPTKDSNTMLAEKMQAISYTVGNKTVWMFGSFGLCIEYIFWLNG